MPVSLERRIAEVEPNVITEAMTRDCIQIVGGDPDNAAEKKAHIAWRDVECLVYSFKGIAMIDNLNGLKMLTKLQLDNNEISKIENISHLVNLTWLDLSFNKITKIEGLETLVKLVDLSLFNNNIEVIENLDSLTGLNVFSIGNNQIKKLDNVMYLRKFSNLRLVNLAGNPFCKEHDYRSYVLSHIKDLTYLDYRRVAAADVTSAKEHHQDEMLELQEVEEQAALEEKTALEKAANATLMRDANLDGTITLLEDMIREDPEWARIVQVPGLADGWNDVKEKCTVVTEDFKVLILEQHAKKKAEHEDWLAVVKGLLDERDAQAKSLILEYEKIKKKVGRAIAENPGDVFLIDHPKIRLLALKDELLEIEMDTVESLAELIGEFDRNYSEICDGNKAHFSSFFGQIRDFQNNFFAALSATGLTMFEKYSGENGDMDSLPEGARSLLAEKETLVNALQASHDSHTVRIDALEDRLVTTELRRANELAHSNAMWAAKRNRDRVSEVINFIERNMIELEEMADVEDMGEG